MDRKEQENLIRKLAESKKLNPITWGEIFTDENIRKNPILQSGTKITPKDIVAQLRGMTLNAEKERSWDVREKRKLLEERKQRLLVNLSSLLDEAQQLELLKRAYEDFQIFNKMSRESVAALYSYLRQKADERGDLEFIQKMDQLIKDRLKKQSGRVNIQDLRRDFDVAVKEKERSIRLRERAETASQGSSNNNPNVRSTPLLPSEEDVQVMGQIVNATEKSPQEVFKVLDTLETDNRISNAVLAEYGVSSVDELAGYLGWMSMALGQPSASSALAERLKTRRQILGAFERILRDPKISEEERNRVRKMSNVVKKIVDREGESISPQPQLSDPVGDWVRTVAESVIPRIHERNVQEWEYREAQRASARIAADEEKKARNDAEAGMRLTRREAEVDAQRAESNARVQWERERSAFQGQVSIRQNESPSQQIAPIPASSQIGEHVFSSHFEDRHMNDSTPFGEFTLNTSEVSRRSRRDPSTVPQEASAKPSINRKHVEIHQAPPHLKADIGARLAAEERARNPLPPEPEPPSWATPGGLFGSSNLSSNVRVLPSVPEPSAFSSNADLVQEREYPNWRRVPAQA